LADKEKDGLQTGVSQKPTMRPALHYDLPLRPEIKTRGAVRQKSAQASKFDLSSKDGRLEPVSSE